MGDEQAWAARRDLIRALGRLQQACLREIDRTQIGGKVNGQVTEAFMKYREARLAYHLAHDTPGAHPPPA